MAKLLDGWWKAPTQIKAHRWIDMADRGDAGKLLCRGDVVSSLGRYDSMPHCQKCERLQHGEIPPRRRF